MHGLCADGISLFPRAERFSEFTSSSGRALADFMLPTLLRRRYERRKIFQTTGYGANSV
jgi:hypothetical protein